MANDKGYTGDNFIIDGTINFGILVGLNQNVNLTGIHNALINCQNQAYQTTVGIAVGSLIGEDDYDYYTYTGNLLIDSSVSVNVDSSLSAEDFYLGCGVMIPSTAPDSTITINGRFDIEFGGDGTVGVYAMGYLLGDMIINGIFNIYSSSYQTDGILIGSTGGNSVTTINGIFNITIDNEESMVIGVDITYGAILDNSIIIVDGVFNIVTNGSTAIGVVTIATDPNSELNVDGVFKITSTNPSAEGLIIGVYLANSNSKTTIDGVFTIASLSAFITSAIYIEDANPESIQDISGIYTISSINMALGIYVANDFDSYMNIEDAIFTISSIDENVYGLGFDGMFSEDAKLTINDQTLLDSDKDVVFALSSTQGECAGVIFSEFVEGATIEGTPKFYANTDDYGNWTEYNGDETWNTDSALELVSIYDTPTSTGANFWVDVISDASDTNKTDFNDVYINKLLKFMKNVSNTSKQWLNDIVIKIPSDTMLFITETNCSDYLIENGIDIYIEPSATRVEHNKLLNLASMALAKSFTGNKFIINGTIDFGILVGFDQDATLIGINDALINLQDQTQETMGIAIGSTTEPSSVNDYVYSGHMFIDSSVCVNISSTNYAMGMVLYDTAADSSLDINGIFDISVHDYFAGGVSIWGIINGEANINGVFNINVTNALEYSTGVYINGINPDGTVVINGVFNISSDEDVYGVNVSGAIDEGSITIHGVFAILSTGNDNGYGVRFESAITGSVTIDGVFAISSVSGDSYGVLFDNDIHNTAIVAVDGIFTIAAENGWSIGICMASALEGSATIDGVFTLSSTEKIYGVMLDSNINEVVIGGVFAMFCDNDESITNRTFGVLLDSRMDIGSVSGEPLFYSNKVDSGNWKYYADEVWNGSSIYTDPDIELTIKTVYDTPTSADANFWVNVLNTAIYPNKDTFNQHYKDGLTYCTSILPSDSIAIGWLNSIIAKI